MNDAAYDITYLLESELVDSAASNLRVVKTPATTPRAPVDAVVRDELAGELMQSAEIHEALIQQYLMQVANV